MKRLILAVVAIAALAIGGSAPLAWAHVLVVDDSGQVGAILHVSPDDAPVAGQDSQLFLDINRKLPAGVSAAKLLIDDESGDTDEITAKLAGNQLEVDYNFPRAGVYNLEFTIGSGDQQLVFRQPVRVLGGASNGQVESWVIGALVATSVGIVALVVIFAGNIRGIWRQSRF